MSFLSPLAIFGMLTFKAKILLIVVGLSIVGGAGVATRTAIVSINQQSVSGSTQLEDDLSSTELPATTSNGIKTDTQVKAKNDSKATDSTKSKSTGVAKSDKKSPSATPSQSTPPTTPPQSTPPAAGCVGQLHTPGGPDGMGGCWPYEGNTGVPAGVSLSTYTGPCAITTANTVIDRKVVNCGLDIRAANVKITNSQINGPIRVDTDHCGLGYSFSVTDSNIHVDDINYRGLMVCNYTATRVEVTGGQSMAWCASCTIQDSYLHSPLEDPAGAAANHAAHNSTVRMAANAIIRHNTLWCAVKQYEQPNGQDASGCSANQTGYSHDGNPPHNSTVEANLYMPTTGGFCAYGGSTAGDLGAVHHIVFKNNIFKRGTNMGEHGQYVCGYWGAIANFDSSRPGNQWINNRWDDGTILLP